MIDQPLSDTAHIVDAMSKILLFFGIAGLAVPILQRFKMSPVLAYLLCGVIIGPYGLASFSDSYPWLKYFVIKDDSTVHTLGELGIVALMFMIGLELSLNRLRELKKLVFGLGSTQIIISALVICLIALFFNNSMEASILIGASFALSSTAIVMQLLEDKRLSNRPVGILCFSILLMQDLAVVPILVLAGAFSGGDIENTGSMMVKALAIGAITITIMYVVGKKFLKPILKYISISRNAEWLSAFIVFFVIACASITNAFGLSPALGAFIAGLLIAETEFRHEVEVITDPLKGMLLGIFFLSIGMMINLTEVVRTPFLLFVSVIGIYLVKASIILPLCRIFGISWKRSSEAAIYLAQPGEFALMIINVALLSKLIPVESAQFFLLVTATAMMLTPLLFKLAPVVGEYVNRVFPELSDEGQLIQNDEKLVIIAGFGRVGQMVGKLLEEQKIPYIAVDNNVERVQKLKKDGYRIVYGDAKKIKLWQKLHNGSVIAAVVAIDDHTATDSMLKSIRRQWPMLPVIIRSKDTTDMVHLYDMGAKYVVAETLESSLRISRLLMEEVGIENAEIEHSIKKAWEQNCVLSSPLFRDQK